MGPASPSRFLIAVTVMTVPSPPTKPMKARAAAAGFYSAGGRDYEKVQILTIEELFDGKRPAMPWLDPSVFKKAKREASAEKQGSLL